MIIKVKTELSSYDVVIENGIINNVSNFIDANRKILIISDSGIPNQYIHCIENQFSDHNTFVLDSGENSKNYLNYQKILQVMLENNYDRKSAIIAIGGGVVGDLAGFVAATYMRGIDFYNIPTTFLSQIDSSIGGKTAINFMGFKNIVGAFYQPKCVLIDPSTLKTLSKRQLNSGLVEAIKMALLKDKSLFELIENSSDVLCDAQEIITKSLLIKKEIVELDEKEKGIRKILNFGHTIGHAIESLSNGELLHGECVGIGMLYMAKTKIKNKISLLLNKFNLPTMVNYSKKEIIEFIKHDKKTFGNKIDIIYLHDVEQYEIKTLPINEFVSQL